MIKDELTRLNDVYHSMEAEMHGYANELELADAREEALGRDLEDARTTNFKLTCAKKDLAEHVHHLKSAAAETEEERRRLRREAERAKTVAEKHSLEDTIRKCKAEIEQAIAETRRLQGLIPERDEEI
ncbi:hypothetical protein N657DRAFT_692014 [Parathielavia appendiculata]|uniref:Uncharacterized protein n=1 Tax=Parathielavia appendiculata TaxID=2587402 RepID=A0AAN6TVD6_9PEZI|nr:hypothetical protein N657DRAFT_692014 [Parathielavia appendiculata]